MKGFLCLGHFWRSQSLGLVCRKKVAKAEDPMNVEQRVIPFLASEKVIRMSLLMTITLTLVHSFIASENHALILIRQ